MENKFTELTQQQRLKYLITKYFYTQKEFAEKAKIEAHLISNYLNSKMKKISKKSLEKIEKNVEFSMDFILYGIGNELVEGCKLKPLIPISTPVVMTTNKEKSSDKFNNKQTIRGNNIKKMTLTNWRRDSILTNISEINVADFVLNGIGKPLLIEIVSEDFCKKYNYRSGSIIVMDESREEDGDLVLIHYNKQHYLCDYINGRLLDYADAEKPHPREYPIGENGAKILGAIYSVTTFV